jgi:hypothetical protein
MEFRDKKQTDGKLQLDAQGNRTYAFEVLLTNNEEVELIHLAIRGLAHNILSNNTDGVGPINSGLILDYIEKFAGNRSRLTFTSGEAERFARLLRISATTVLGQVQGQQVTEMASDIEQEAAIRPFRRKLDSTRVDDLFN